MSGNEFDKMIAEKIAAAVLRYETKILPVLHEVDMACIYASGEMMRLRASEEETNKFNAGRDALKRLIHEIEKGEIINDKETNQLEA